MELRLKAEVVDLRNVQYPHIGDGENKIFNAYIEDAKTVGYGRKETENGITYSNPFDPRLTFNGLVDIFSCGDTKESERTAEQLAENVFLALENPSTFMDDYFYGYHRHVNQLLEPPKTDLTSDITKVTIRRCNSGRKSRLGPELSVEDDGTEECKALFERIKSDIVKCLFDENDDEDFDKNTDGTKKQDSPPKQTTNLSGDELQGNCTGGNSFGQLKNQKEDVLVKINKTARESVKDLATFTNSSDIKHNSKRWSEKCWTRKREIANKRDVSKDGQQLQTVSSKEKDVIDVNTTDKKEIVDVSTAESSTSTIEVTSQTFPPLASTVVCEENANQQQKQLSDNWAEKLFKSDRTNSEINHSIGLENKYYVYANKESRSNKAQSATKDIQENDDCEEIKESPILSRLSPTSKPFIPASLKEDADDVHRDDRNSENSYEVPQNLKQETCQTDHRETTNSQPTQTNALQSYQQVYQSNPPAHSIRPTLQQHQLQHQQQQQQQKHQQAQYQSQQPHQQQQAQLLYWNQQRRSAYGGNTAYPSQLLSHHTQLTRDKWPASDVQALSSQQVLASQLQLPTQGQHISPPPGFAAQNSQHGMRYSQYPVTHLDPAIQSFSRQIDSNRVMEQQQSSAFTLLGTLSIPQRYSQSQSPQHQFFSNLRQPCYQNPVGQLQQQLLNYRPNWATYNTNNNMNYNNCNNLYGDMNAFHYNTNGNTNNNCDEMEEDADDNDSNKTVIKYSVSSIESIESDNSRESSSKERAKLKPKPTRSNLIQIVPTED